MKVYFTRKRWIMKFEILKKTYLKRNILIGVLVVGVITAVILNFTRAKYKTTQSIPLVNGTINYSLADLNIVAITIDGEESDKLPQGNYELLDSSYCTIDGENANLTLSWDSDTQTLTVSPFTTKGTKCYLDFSEVVSVSDTLLANYPTQLTRTDFSTTITETTTGAIYYEDTSKGRTYYFAGNPTDNWVQFGGFYWRIIRINEDGTIRLIYQGTGANTTAGTQIKTNTFNSSWDDNMYVGYMYETNQVHGLTNNSIIKGILDTWYQNNLTGISDKIDGNAGFCGDRTPYSGTGLGMTRTDYAAYNRLVNNKAPTFECQNDSDLYTTVGSSQGNGALTYPIGLITADEVAYAGGVYGTSNGSYYLFTKSYSWTMSPSSATSAGMFVVEFGGGITQYAVNNSSDVRPVINLKANVTISSGNGTASQPYVIS